MKQKRKIDKTAGTGWKKKLAETVKFVGRQTKKGSFLAALLLCGAIYFTCLDGWQVYAGSVETLGRLWKSDMKERPGSPGTGADAEDRQEQGSVSSNEAQTGFGMLEMGRTISDGNGTGSVSDGNAGGHGTEEDHKTGEIAYRTVEDDYFADAVFIGDSRTVGLYEYGGLEETAAFYASKGLTIYKLFDSPIVEIPGRKKKATVEEMLSEKQFSKIYLMIGINEMGTGTVESFLEKYKETVDRLQELQPDAVIYIQGIIKVTTERSQKGDYINNEGIEARNEGLAELADNEKVFYLDVNPLICDETGGMESSYTFDGVHLKAQYITIWKDFLKSHAIVPTSA